ncbi:MAG: tetratricopeptide repeat protein [Azospirillaceae bacterium]|nr:tetratricopeptide repeat protein [Azospirillaceae bacterium]
MDARLPALENFNHVLVRATLDGKAYWLDGTRTGDRGLDDLEIPNFHWGLPLAAKGATLVPVIPKPLDRPASNVDIRIDATAGVHAPAPIHVQSVFTGDAAVGLKLSLANYAPPELERGLRDYWRKQYDFVDVQSVSANYDPGTGAETLVMDGTAHMDWSRRNYETDGTGVGYRADFKRTPGPHDDAPYVTAFPLYTRTAETILLPYDGRGFTISNRADVDSTVAGVRYRRSAGLKGGTFTVETTRRSTVPEFPAADAPAAQQTLRDLAAAAVYVYMPSAYRLTPKDIEVEQARQLTTADDYITRGNDLMTAGDLDHAIADFDRAVALNPKSATALADRGQAFYYKRNFELARRDFDLADAADPRNAVTFRGRGMMALDQADMKGAIAAFTTSLEIDPNNTFALTQRARAYSVLDDYPHALADMETALRIQPDVTQGYAECASLYLEMHDKEKAADEAVKVITANPDLADAHFVSGTIYRMLERNADAFKAFSRSLELKPQPATYLNRARVRPVEDLAGQNADLDAALAMDPKFVPAYRERASLAVKAGDMEGAIAAYTAALDAKPGNADALLQRGLLYAKMGKPDLENADFVAARANVQNPVGLNNMCWVKATMGGDLQSALADCDASLAMEQSQSARSAALDSRGFVLLRLERYDEAIANFDDALKIMPTRYMSRYGRGIAHLRKGEREAGEADIAKVQASDPEAEKEYAKYGVTP